MLAGKEASAGEGLQRAARVSRRATEPAGLLMVQGASERFLFPSPGGSTRAAFAPPPGREHLKATPPSAALLLPGAASLSSLLRPCCCRRRRRLPLRVARPASPRLHGRHVLAAGRCASPVAKFKREASGRAARSVSLLRLPRPGFAKNWAAQQVEAEVMLCARGWGRQRVSCKLVHALSAREASTSSDAFACLNGPTRSKERNGGGAASDSA